MLLKALMSYFFYYGLFSSSSIWADYSYFRSAHGCVSPTLFLCHHNWGCCMRVSSSATKHQFHDNRKQEQIIKQTSFSASNWISETEFVRVLKFAKTVLPLRVQGAQICIYFCAIKTICIKYCIKKRSILTRWVPSNAHFFSLLDEDSHSFSSPALSWLFALKLIRGNSRIVEFARQQMSGNERSLAFNLIYLRV